MDLGRAYNPLGVFFVYEIICRFGLTMKKEIIPLLLFLCTINAQIGNILWEKNFIDLDNWMIITGNGFWGWGNGELQFYHEENVEITHPKR